MLLGAIADDLTGATDLALMLVRGGMRTIQVIGVPVPGDARELSEYDAVVVALKSRTSPVDEAISQTLASADVLREAGAHQLFFKYCSTFDSTDKGNIGPVSEALLDFLKVPLTLACPAFPANGRSVYQGYLFVGDKLLNESSMRNHPLTPMHDASLVRVLQRQSDGDVGLIPYSTVEAGPAAIRTALESAAKKGLRQVIVDAISERHLVDIGHAADGMPLITGGSGIAMGLPANFIRSGQLIPAEVSATLDAPEGRPVILAGSCSEATRGQIANALEAGIPALEIDADKIIEGKQTATELCDWAVAQDAKGPCLIYSSADPRIVAEIQERHGVEKAGAAVEKIMAETAKLLVLKGFTRFLVAGGETSGAVVNGLGVPALEIGPEIDPGVPWTRSIGSRKLALALKSGNFGAPDFFIKAWGMLT
ncbi:MAG: four-carbon acid sugar kinase family protein [Rhodobiaceae bacterium]|nr:four-carbon acid sugar kinase family protein [Rhodobiaceae bacterium]MCC0048161.1 four-carbon acid sugar kinase family protein [Rhodobiaceae bacterium]